MSRPGKARALPVPGWGLPLLGSKPQDQRGAWEGQACNSRWAAQDGGGGTLRGKKKAQLPPARGVDLGSGGPTNQQARPPDSVTPGGIPAEPPRAALGLAPRPRPPAGLGPQAWRLRGSLEGLVPARRAAGDPEAGGETVTAPKALPPWPGGPASGPSGLLQGRVHTGQEPGATRPSAGTRCPEPPSAHIK